MRLGFNHTDVSEDSDTHNGIQHYESSGWYLDDFSIEKRQVLTPPLAEGFENSWNGWYAENGVWEVGVPTSGPGGAHSGTNCAATVLGGDYPWQTSSRLVSPAIDLPTAAANEAVVLKFWQWLSYWSGFWIDPNYNSGSGGNDNGQVQVSVYNASTLQWSSWTNLMTVSHESLVWSLAQVDLTAYAGQRVRLGFNHTDVSEDSNTHNGIQHYESAGWYIDEVSIEKRPVQVFAGSEGFEGGWNGWYAENGIWEVGVPTYGPPTNSLGLRTHSGTNCAATVLGGNYPWLGSSRLVSPVMDLPAVGANEAVVLKFWQWFSYYSGYWNDGGSSGWGGNDYGQVQVQVYNTNTLHWSGWIDLLRVSYGSGGWVRPRVDLTAYAGQRVRLGFNHTDVSEDSDPYRGIQHYESSGWYIDDVQIASGPEIFNNPETFEFSWGDWDTDNWNLWQIGIPTYGPPMNTNTGSRAYSPVSCAATLLGGNYAASSSGRLISPSFTVPSVNPGSVLVARFWQYFQYGTGDSGLVQIAPAASPTNWTTLNISATNGTSTNWSQAFVDLTPYQGQQVRLGFYHTANSDASVGAGWYLDNLELSSFVPTPLTLGQPFTN